MIYNHAMLKQEKNVPSWTMERRGIVILGIISMVLCLLFFSPTNVWRWDPSFYYAQMRAPIIDHTLDFRNETIPHDGVRQHTITGLQPSLWPIGPGLLWTPFFLLAHVYVVLIYGGGVVTGFTLPYIAAVSAGSALYGVLGLFVTYRVCQLFGNNRLALLTTAAILLTSPLFYYVYRQPIMAHSVSFLAAASLLLVCVLLDQGVIQYEHSGIAIGICVGLNILVRWTSVLLAIIPLVLMIMHLAELARAHHLQMMKRTILQCIYASGICLLVISPQLALWYKMYHALFVFPTQGFSGGIFPTNILKIFFHTNRGLIYWSPMTLIGMIGIGWIKRHNLRIAFITYIIAHLYVLGLWSDWFSGGGFGQRYFIEVLPIVAIGCMTICEKAWNRSKGKYMLITLLALAILHQFVLMAMVDQNLFPMSAYYSGASLSLILQINGIKHFILHLGGFFLPRANVIAERQAILTSYFAGYRTLSFYVMTLVGTLTLAGGTIMYIYVERARNRNWLYLLIVLYMIGWSCFLLGIKT